MRKRSFITMLLMLMLCMSASAQRFMDKLNRGVVAIKVSGGVYVNWRIHADEYYGVTYNLYRDGTKIAENLEVSNYTDAAGSTSSKYSVAPVVRGTEQEQCDKVGVWNNDYLEIIPKHDASLKSTYVPNDACCADVDGDGQVEILLKYDNQSEISQSFPKEGPKINGVDTKEYSLFECLKLDGTVLWWVNCGPNMGDFQNNEQNIVAYDWDQDGRAEAVFRAADGTTIHMADGTVYTVGSASINYRAATGGGTNWFMHSGAEFLLYVDGQTGKPYQCMEYPLKRLEQSENPSNLLSGSAYEGLLDKAWGDGYGHRSSKFFFGAPYLDGRKPSIFLGRGIYTRHKFIAYDVDPSTHQLVERWRWFNNTNGPWKGQGYHNYGIADVDMDGRDEIIWGSMVIDDTGLGLSTTGLGHGDAQHHGDLNPYTWGLEGFFCNEDKPSNNFRDLTTAKLYHRATGSTDDGRCMAGNLTNSIPGAMAFSTQENPISTVTGAVVPSLSKSGTADNFRIYWDDDLCEETFNYRNGKNTEGTILKYAMGAIKTLTGSITNNDSKGTPCYQGDVLGDWREEVIMRTANNRIRIYSSTYPTKWRNYSLWYDHQYRNAMVWQMCGYNQPPHASYFLGEMEGITAAPPALTMSGRTEVSNGGTISDGDAVITCETNDMTVSVADGASPYIYIDNAPSWVKGYAPQETSMENDPSKISYTYYTHTLTGGAFAGDMRLVKQGEGTLVLPKVTETYSGKTEIWNGKLHFDGVMQNSPVWLNRHTELLSDGGSFNAGLEAEYNAVINVAGEDKKGEISVSTLTLNMGSVLALDIYGEGKQIDKVNMTKLVIKHHKEWGEYGPKNLTPVIKLNLHYASGKTALSGGKYLIGTLSEIEGDLSDIQLDGLDGAKAELVHEDGNLYLSVEGLREATDVVWTGAESNEWNLASSKNFSGEGSGNIFVTGDAVTFNDVATNTNVQVAGTLSPSAFIVDASKNYTLGGSGSIVSGSFTKKGTGTVVINNENTYSDGNFLEGGVVEVSSLANSIQTTGGNLGLATTDSQKFLMSNGAEIKNTAAVTLGSPLRVIGEEGGVFNCAGGSFTMEKAIYGGSAKAGDPNSAVGVLHKKGSGAFIFRGTALTPSRIIVEEGTFDNGCNTTKTTEVRGTSYIKGSGFLATPINVAANARATYESINRQTSSNALSGNGQITVLCATEPGGSGTASKPYYYATRNALKLNLTNFEGTLVAGCTQNATKTNSDGAIVTGRQFTLDTNNGNDKFTLNIPANYYVYNYGRTLRVGQITGTGFLCGNWNNGSNPGGKTVWQVGNEKNSDLSVVVGNDAAFTKKGEGKMTVKTTWTNSGAVIVDEGELHANAGITLGTGALTVSENAIFSGIGGTTNTNAKNKVLTNSSVTVNGTLQCGSSANSVGTSFWYFGANPLTFNATGTLVVGVGKNATSVTSPGCTQIVGGATGSSITFKDGATIKVFITTYNPTATEATPDKFYYFTNFETVKWGNVKFDLPELPSNYYWDTTEANTGVLYVRYTPETGVKGVTAADEVNVDVISTTGVTVAQFTSTLSAVKSTFARTSIAKGVYVLRIRKGNTPCGSMTLRK